MFVVEIRIWLPGLPPVSLEVDTGVVDDAVVVVVESHRVEWY